jgi:hypothetical protein
MDVYGIYVVPLFATAFTTTFTMPALLGDVVLAIGHLTQIWVEWTYSTIVV